MLVRQDTSVEEAQLRAAEASVDLANVNLKRTKELFEKATVSQAQFDADGAAAKQAAAAADNIRATIAKRTIKAPFAGRLGIRLVNLGQNLKAGDSIVSLQALEPDLRRLLPSRRSSWRRSRPACRCGSRATAVPGQAGRGQDHRDQPRHRLRHAQRAGPGHRGQRGGPPAPGHVRRRRGRAARRSTRSSRSRRRPSSTPPSATRSTSSTQKADEATGEKQLVVRQQIVRLGVRRGDFVVVTLGPEGRRHHRHLRRLPARAREARST